MIPILVVKGANGWERFERGPRTFTRMVNTGELRRADGSVEIVDVEPYEISEVLDGRKVAELVRDEVWAADDLALYGIKVAEPFVEPAGKQKVGEERFTESKGVVRQKFDVEPIPEPEPAPELTDEEKLAQSGLTVEALRRLLGLEG